MPVCHKCGKLISDKKYARHLKRCGTHHKRPSRPLDTRGDAYYMKM